MCLCVSAFFLTGVQSRSYEAADTVDGREDQRRKEGGREKEDDRESGGQAAREWDKRGRGGGGISIQRRSVVL